MSAGQQTIPDISLTRTMARLVGRHDEAASETKRVDEVLELPNLDPCEGWIDTISSRSGFEISNGKFSVKREHCYPTYAGVGWDESNPPRYLAVLYPDQQVPAVGQGYLLELVDYEQLGDGEERTLSATIVSMKKLEQLDLSG